MWRENHEVFSFVDESPDLLLLNQKKKRPVDPKNSACAGDAYLLAVTTKRVRPHLDNVQKAFCAESTGPSPKPSSLSATEQRSDASTAGVLTNRTELAFLRLSLVNLGFRRSYRTVSSVARRAKPLSLQLSGSSPALKRATDICSLKIVCGQ